MSQINPKLIIERGILIPCKFTKIAQVGIDLTINKDTVIEHGHSQNFNMNEVVKLPKDVFSLLIHRSSFNRRGILITGSVFDPGYNGLCGGTIYNLSGWTITIKKNERVGQMVFFEADAASIYDGKYQNEFLGKKNEI